MIGNDIIDLSEVITCTNARKQRFLDKICTLAEQEFLNHQQEADNWMWLLWSMKESAWKAHFRNSSIRKFNPKSMQCVVSNLNAKGGSVSGVVSVENKQYQTNTFWSRDLIHTTATFTGSVVSHNFFNISSDNPFAQSLNVREKVCQMVSVYLNCSFDAISIEKNECGVPQIVVDGVNSKIQLSISHHGRYGAYAFFYEHNSDN